MALTDGSNLATSIHNQIRTTFLISNLHCPSNVSKIKNALSVLHPKPTSVSPSIISGLVTVHHDPLLLELIISKALEDAGFQIDSAVQGTAASTSRIHDFSNERNRDEGDGWLKKVINGWILNREPVKKLEEKKRDKHVRYCSLCRTGEDEKANAKDMSYSTSFDQRLGEHDN